MKIREYLGGRSKYELLKDLERNSLDARYLKMIRENSEIFYSFHDLFYQLKGSTGTKVHLINEIIEYARNQVRNS